jgi:hypothetical protein
MNFTAVIPGPPSHLGVHIHSWLDASIMLYRVVGLVPEPRRSAPRSLD